MSGRKVLQDAALLFFEDRALGLEAREGIEPDVDLLQFPGEDLPLLLHDLEEPRRHERLPGGAPVLLPQAAAHRRLRDRDLPPGVGPDQ